jgi:hypothetical protein
MDYGVACNNILITFELHQRCGVGSVANAELVR